MYVTQLFKSAELIPGDCKMMVLSMICWHTIPSLSIPTSTMSIAFLSQCLLGLVLYSCPWIAAKICMWTLKVQQEWCTSSYEYPAVLCCTVSTASYCYSRDCPGWKEMIRLYSTTGGWKHYHPWMLSLFAESKDILSSLVITDVVSFTFNCMETVPFNQTIRIALEIANPVQPNVEGKACSQGPPIIWGS